MKLKAILTDLKQPVDNTSLVLFRMVFGLLIAAECIGAIFTGWVKRAFIEPDFTFSFIGFEWLQPLPGSGMYYYYIIMGLLGLMIMLGWYYRYSLGLFTLLWWGTYLMQKSSYNNHYYLLILLCLLMLLLPAHRNASVDVRNKVVPLATQCPKWCIELIKWQLLIVYTYAGLAKLYPGWLEGDFISMAFAYKAHYPIVGDALQTDWLQKLVIYGGVLYDLTIIPIMFMPATRKIGLFISVVFHLFNSVIFGIGIFPYLMLGSLVLFFPTTAWRAKIPGYKSDLPFSTIHTPAGMVPLLVFYFILQLWLPIRHYFIPGNVFITEEGHRMAWRMMLRTKGGQVDFTLVDKNSGKTWKVFPHEYLSSKQVSKLGGRPDMIWQFCQYLGLRYAEQGIDRLEIYANAQVSLNGSPLKPLINPNVDLLAQKWRRFGHNSWILTE